MAAALGALAACSTNFTPASLPTGLQVLGVKSEPADVRPGETADLTILVVDPAQKTPAMTTIFVGCDPDPTGLTPTGCSQYANLEDPTQVIAFDPDGGIAAIPGARLLGFDQEATYTPPADLFASLSPTDINLTRGVLADVISFTVAEVVPIPPTPAQLQGLIGRLQTKTTPYAIALKEIRVAALGPLSENPVLGVVYTPDQVLEPGFGLDLRAGESVALGADTTIGANETYVSIGPDGNMETRTESPIYSWFASTGSMSSPRSTYGSPTQTFDAPSGSSIPAGRTFDMWVVVRDDRGGVDWGTFPGFICDPTQPSPSVSGTAFADPAQPDQLTLSGTNLDQILDASIEGIPFVGGFDAANQAWVGTLPPGPTSAVTITLRATNCSSSSVSVNHL